MLALFTLAALGYAPAPLAEGYLLRGPAPKKGTVLIFTEKHRDEPDGGRKGGWADREHRIELLEVEGRRATRQRVEIRKYDWEDTNGNVFKDNKFAGTQDCRFEGGAWKHSSDIKPWVADDVFFPARAVKVGARWTVPEEELKAHMKERFRIEVKSCSAKGLFRRIETVDGEPCAVVEVEWTIDCMLGGSRFRQTVKQTFRRGLRTGLSRKVNIETEHRSGEGEGTVGRYTVERMLKVEKKP
jgi:hypothetical protein